MWQWLLDECSTIIRTYFNVKEDADDIIQDIMIELINKEDYARQIYESRFQKGRSQLITVCRYKAFSYRAHQLTDSKDDYSCYCRIVGVCNKYNIPVNPEYAYKIAPLIPDRDYTIAKVEKVLTLLKPRTESLDYLIETNLYDRT